MQPNKVIPYGKQFLDETDISSVIEVLKSDYLTQGPAVANFEQSLAVYLGVKHVIAVNSGTAALHIAALSAGLGKGDAAFVPAITFAATSNAVLYTGATPIFVDIEKQTNGMCPNSLEVAISLAVKKGLTPKVILPVHYAGLPCQMNAIYQIANKYGLSVIEDACHALGAELNNIKIGSMQGLNMTALSFHPVKHITTGEGGAVTTCDDNLAERLREFRSHGITKNSENFTNPNNALDSKTGQVNPWYHEMQTLGLNYRIPDILAVLGITQLKKINSFVERRREIAKFYQENLQNIDYLTCPPADYSTVKHSYHLYPITINYAELGKSRKQVMDELRNLGVGSQVHYIPVFWHPFYKNNPNLWDSVLCDNSAKFYETELSIPMYPAMTQNDVKQVVDALKLVIQKLER